MVSKLSLFSCGEFAEEEADVNDEQWAELRSFVDALGYPVELLIVRQGKWDREVWDPKWRRWYILMEFAQSDGYVDEPDYDPNTWMPEAEP